MIRRQPIFNEVAEGTLQHKVLPHFQLHSVKGLGDAYDGIPLIGCKLMDIGKSFLVLDENNDGYWLVGEMDEKMDGCIGVIHVNVILN
jgi:hypothetical protein